MENLDFTDTLEEEPGLGQGFSKAQLLTLSVKDIEKLSFREHPEAFGKGEENPNKSQTDEKDPSEGGPRPPKEEEFPDGEKEELFSEVSDPEEND